MEKILTLFYMKKSGVIKCFCSGKQTLDYYGDEKEDIEGVIDYIYVEYDEFLLKNLQDFRVENGKVVFKKNVEIKLIN